jgi:hypothetical protein
MAMASSKTEDIKLGSTEQILNEIGGYPEVVQNQTLSSMEIIKRKLSSFSTERIAPLFHTKNLGVTTVLLWFCWLTIGIGNVVLTYVISLEI